MSTRAKYSEAIKRLSAIQTCSINVYNSAMHYDSFSFSNNQNECNAIVRDAIGTEYTEIRFYTNPSNNKKLKGSCCLIEFLNSRDGIYVKFAYRGYSRSVQTDHIDFYVLLKDVSIEKDWNNLQCSHDVTWNDYNVIKNKYHELITFVNKEYKNVQN